MLTPGAVAPLLNNPQFCEALFPHLPESSARTPEEIQAIVRTPQFSQAMVSLSAALESGQLGPLLRQFGLGPNAGDGNVSEREFVAFGCSTVLYAHLSLCVTITRRCGRVPELYSRPSQEGDQEVECL